MVNIARLVDLFFQALYILILVYVFGSWVPSLQRQSWFRTVRQIVDPMCEPFRRILPPEKLGGLDISPILLILVLGILRSLVQQLLVRF